MIIWLVQILCERPIEQQPLLHLSRCSDRAVESEDCSLAVREASPTGIKHCHASVAVMTFPPHEDGPWSLGTVVLQHVKHHRLVLNGSN